MRGHFRALSAFLGGGATSPHPLGLWHIPSLPWGPWDTSSPPPPSVTQDSLPVSRSSASLTSKVPLSTQGNSSAGSEDEKTRMSLILLSVVLSRSPQA